MTVSIISWWDFVYDLYTIKHEKPQSDWQNLLPVYFPISMVGGGGGVTIGRKVRIFLAMKSKESLLSKLPLRPLVLTFQPSPTLQQIVTSMVVDGSVTYDTMLTPMSCQGCDKVTDRPLGAVGAAIPHSSGNTVLMGL